MIIKLDTNKYIGSISLKSSIILRRHSSSQTFCQIWRCLATFLDFSVRFARQRIIVCFGEWEILLEIIFSQFGSLFVIQSSWWHIKDNAWVNMKIILPQTDPGSELWSMKLKLTRPLARNRLSDYRCYFPISSPLCHTRSNPCLLWNDPRPLDPGRGRQSGATELSAPVSGSLPWWQHNTVQLPSLPCLLAPGILFKVCPERFRESISVFSRFSWGQVSSSPSQDFKHCVTTIKKNIFTEQKIRLELGKISLASKWTQTKCRVSPRHCSASPRRLSSVC